MFTSTFFFSGTNAEFKFTANEGFREFLLQGDSNSRGRICSLLLQSLSALLWRLGVQAASGAGWERAEILLLLAEILLLCAECLVLPHAIHFLLQTQSPEPLVHFFGRDLRTDRHDALQNQKIPSLTFPSTVSFNGYGPLFASNFNSLQMKDFRKSLLRTLIPELKRYQ